MLTTCMNAIVVIMDNDPCKVWLQELLLIHLLAQQNPAHIADTCLAQQELSENFNLIKCPD